MQCTFGLEALIFLRREDEDLARAVLDDLFEGKQAVSFLGTPLAQGEQAAEQTVGGAVGRQAEQLRSLRRHAAGAEEKVDLHLRRSEARRVGKGCVRTCRSRGTRDPSQKNNR